MRRLLVLELLKALCLIKGWPARLGVWSRLQADAPFPLSRKLRTIHSGRCIWTSAFPFRIVSVVAFITGGLAGLVAAERLLVLNTVCYLPGQLVLPDLQPGRLCYHSPVSPNPPILNAKISGTASVTDPHPPLILLPRVYIAQLLQNSAPFNVIIVCRGWLILRAVNSRHQHWVLFDLTRFPFH
jgi:hypothetical protein